VDLLALGHQGVSREWVGVLAADQHSDAADAAVDDGQAATVTICPHQLFIESRNEFAVMVEDRAVRADQDVGVPQAADRGCGSLSDAEGNEHVMALGGHADFCNLWPIDAECLCGHGHEEIMRQDWCLKGRPDGEARHERLGKGHQRGASLGCFRDQITRLVDRFTGIQEHRGCVAGGNFRAGEHSWRHELVHPG
jgi:hypothetical protein